MNHHEYQGKQLFAEFGLPVSKHEVIFNAGEAIQACNKIGGTKWVVKAQVHAGGRGKAGGVKLIESPEEARDFADLWLGKRLKTYQTDENGQLVSAILIESCTDIDKELYLSAVIDRSSQSVTFIASSEGGVNIEKVASKTPEKIIYENIDPLTGPQPFQARRISSVLGLDSNQAKQFSKMFQNFVKLFNELDLSLLEVNPLVINSEGKLHCLDAKINLDSNALYRHPSLVEMHDPTQEDPRESEAAKHDLSYVSLEGNIGCMVNGAGLAMATMDIIKLFGQTPANFLDVGGGASKEKVSAALKLILSDKNVKGILINIFGGIMRCDILAEGVVDAASEIKIELPIVVRLAGTNVEEGNRILKNSNLKIITASDLSDAAKKIVSAIK